MKYVIDIDGVICNEDVSVIERSGVKKRIEHINKLFRDGHEIVYFTARGMNSQNDDQILAAKKYRDITETQLEEWGCEYHALFFGKPNCDYYVDNKNMDMKVFFNESD